MPVLLTTHLIGDLNRSRVLQAFCDHGPLSRADLARLAQVPRATIGAIVQNLLEAGLVEEQEPDRLGKVGKPGRPLWFGPWAGLSVAVAFMPDRVVSALVNARGERLEESHVPLVTYEASEAQLVDAVEKAARAVLPETEEVLGLGVVVPGVCEPAREAGTDPTAADDDGPHQDPSRARPAPAASSTDSRTTMTLQGAFWNT